MMEKRLCFALNTLGPYLPASWNRMLTQSGKPSGPEDEERQKIEDLYNRIPDEFKSGTGDSSGETEDTSEENRDDDSRGHEDRPAGPQVTIENRDDPQYRRDKGIEIPQSLGRSPFGFSPLLVLLAIGLLFYAIFSVSNSSQNTEISWTGFNYILNEIEKSRMIPPAGRSIQQMTEEYPYYDPIESVNLRGNILTGVMRAPLELDTLPTVLPDGDKLFKQLLAKYTSRLKAEDRERYAQFSFDNLWAKQYFPKKKGQKTDEAYEIVYLPTKKRTGIVITRRFSCEVPTLAFSDQSVDERIRKYANSYTSTTPTDNTGIFMFIFVATSVLLFWFLFRTMRRTNEQMMSGGFGNFNKSPARRYDPNSQRVTFNDVAGLDNVKNELEEIVDFLRNPEKYQRMGATVPKGTLLFGPPGTGKTLLGRAVAGEAGVPFFTINGSEFIQMFVGVGASRVRDLFNSAKENAPAILFIDEIDAVGRQRGTGVGGGQDEREQTLNQILSEMDGFTPNESVMVMAATNRPDVLDPALMRPGRFDRHITVDRPSLKGRIEIFEVYLKKIPKADNVDVDKLARSTVGFTGADIRNLVNEATLWATRNNKDVVEMSDFEFAHEKVVMGLKREETISEADKRKTAYHEAGHTILGWFSPIKSHVHKVTIIPRGRSLGATYFLPDEDQVNINESQIQATLVRYLGGRAAERIVFNESSAGAEEDLKQATELARRMVIHWGMSEKLGPVAFRVAESTPFLGRDMSSEVREFSESTAKLVDDEIFRILREADTKAHSILREKRDLLEKLCEALVDQEELDQSQLTEILGPSPGPDGTSHVVVEEKTVDVKPSDVPQM